ncbi:MAG: ADP-heptose--LPS heptosyltransferase [Ignavibacteriaceae bacterium]|nr:MAG: lipopolysaccharide heptosyltransferase family protein [Chlorobiota bacterium]GJQ33131.1 MAG: ADP-heptose--LPS heptosyltransferase [Ignavibacteriaceae bacterium]
MNSFARAFYRLLFSPPAYDPDQEKNPRKILIIRQHNQLGDLLASSSLFRAIKAKYPEAKITLVVSPANKDAVAKNKFIDRVVVFDKGKHIWIFEFFRFLSVLREGYDWVIVPVTVSISFTSCLMAGIAKARLKVGPKYLDGKYNEADLFFNRKVVLDWRNHPDMHIAERILDIVKPLGVEPAGYAPEVSVDTVDVAFADQFLNHFEEHHTRPVIGLHTGAGKVPNRWYYKNFVAVIQTLREKYDACIYLTGSSADISTIEKIMEELPFTVLTCIDRSIPEVAAVIARSDLFITNDTGIMHVAGSTATPQISLFGPTNPFVWAPMGTNKVFMQRSDIIDNITVAEVCEVADRLLLLSNKRNKNA